MTPETIIHTDWDKMADILYVARDGANLENLINIASKKIAGIVKRVDPETKECVGFIIHGFGRLYPAYARMSPEQLKIIMDWSLRLSSDCAHAVSAF